MDEQEQTILDGQPPAVVYEPPVLVEVGEFREDTLGGGMCNWDWIHGCWGGG